MLEKNEIAGKNIVQHSHVNGVRDSTYDATVGTIIRKGKDKGASYILKPRGVVWVVSQEEFHMPLDVTALATVRTTWAHKGVFALNVGVVDPGWKGPVATALVNFSMEEFEVKAGEGFMRLVFIEHTPVISTPPQPFPRDQYVREIKLKSLLFADSFLNMNALVKEVSKQIFTPRSIAQYLAVFGLLLAFLAIFVPIAYSVLTDSIAGKLLVGKLEHRVEQLEDTEKKREKHDLDMQVVRDNSAKKNETLSVARSMQKSPATSATSLKDSKQ